MDILSNDLSIQDSCDILGVRYSDDAKTIRANFTKLVFEHHPDKGGDKYIFDLISKAYKCIKESKRVNSMPAENIDYTIDDEYKIDETKDVNFVDNSSVIMNDGYKEFEGKIENRLSTDYEPLENVNFNNNVVYVNADVSCREILENVDLNQKTTDCSQLYGIVERGKMSTTFGNSKGNSLTGYDLGEVFTNAPITIYENEKDSEYKDKAILENEFEQMIQERSNHDQNLQQNVEPLDEISRNKKFDEEHIKYLEKCADEHKRIRKSLRISDKTGYDFYKKEWKPVK